MAWDFSTEPEFNAKLDWMRAFVRENIWPLETLTDELGYDGLVRVSMGGCTCRSSTSID